jgi:hypothetical protein
MKKIGIVLLCAAFFVLLTVDSAGIAAAVRESVMLCLDTVIPSLFAFLVLSTLIMSSGILRGQLPIFLMSLAGGYPVGAKLLSESNFPDKQKSHMMMYCYCASPVFLMALHSLGIWIWLSNALACTVFAVIFGIGKSEKPQNKPAIRIDLVNSVTSAGITLYKICAMIVAFGIIVRAFEFIGITNGYIRSGLEITNIITLQTHPAIIAALTSAGGACVLFQIRAVAGGISLRRFLLARIPIAALSAGICHLLTQSITVEAIAKPRVFFTSGNSVAASACLLVMTLMLLQTRLSSYK